MSNSNSAPLDDDNNRPNIEKSGLYDLQQVKRLIDDEVILVSYQSAHKSLFKLFHYESLVSRRLP